MILKLPYALNLLILIPIAVPTLLGLFETDQGKFKDSVGWRSLVGSLWTAILLLSMVGLIFPIQMVPILILQIIYKVLWLLVYVAPRLTKQKYREIPSGIAISFLLIVGLWPWVVPWSEFFSMYK